MKGRQYQISLIFFFYNLAQEKKPPPLLPTIQWTKLTKKI